MQFRIGDIVRYIENDTGLKGLEGTVIGIHDDVGSGVQQLHVVVGSNPPINAPSDRWELVRRNPHAAQ